MLYDPCKAIVTGKACKKAYAKQTLVHELCDYCVAGIKRRALEGAMRIRARFGVLG